MAHGMSDHCPGCRALVSGGRAQGHTEECRIRVEGELRKTEDGKARLRAAASRVGDATTGRALKRVRFAADRVEDDTETPEGTSASAPSSLLAEAATTNSLPTPSSESALPASAVEVPEVKLSMKRSSDSPNSESDTKRLHTDHSTRDVVMLLDDSDVSHAVERCGVVCRRKGTFLVDVKTGTVNIAITCVPLAQMVQLLLAPVVEPPENSCRMNRVSLISLLQPAIAMVTCRGRPS